MIPAAIDSYAEGQDSEFAVQLEFSRYGHSQALDMRLHRMTIAIRDQGNANLELTGQIFFLEVKEPAQQAASAVVPDDAYRTVDITVECA